MTKFIFDRIVSLFALPIVILLCIPLFVIIRLESPGNPLFIQQRVGRNLRTFYLFKLRTMRADTIQAGSHEVSGAQVTKVGKFLRRTKLDELPQIWNVFIGDMSFVGPRPCLPTQRELVEYRQKRNVFSVRPGITGPAQIAGIDMSKPLDLSIADAKYVIKNNFLSDVKLILVSLLGRGSGDAVNLDKDI